jgi:hypothetical protein
MAAANIVTRMGMVAANIVRRMDLTSMFLGEQKTDRVPEAGY